MKTLAKGSRFWTIAPYVWLASIPMAFAFDNGLIFERISIVFLSLGGAKSVMSSYRSNGGEHQPEEK